MQCGNMTEPFSLQTFKIIQVSVSSVMTGGFGAFGIASNAVSIVVFYRQGILTSSSIVSLTGLAFSDLINCVLTVVSALGLIQANFFALDSSQSTGDSLSFVYGNRLLEITIQTTCLITAFMTIERVISVLFPFKVKSIFTPVRSLCVVIAMFAGTLVLCFPITFQYTTTIGTHPIYNYTYLQVIDAGFFEPWMLDAQIYGNTFTIRLGAIISVAICNVILIHKVNQSSKFRKGAATGNEITDNSKDSEQTQTQTKELKLVKMVTAVSVVFTICYSIFVIFTLFYWVIFEYCVDIHAYHFVIAYNVTNFFQIVNSSTTAIIYYIMSSRFKEELVKMKCC